MPKPDLTAAGQATPLGHRDVLRIAVPITLSNATVPLIGFVDTAVIGQLGQAHLMGAVAIGALVFSMLYWTFSFLRMGTTGLTAQALGAGESREMAGHLYRALFVAVIAGLLILVLQVPIRHLALQLTGGSPEVISAAATYYNIRIWAAPAGLVNFAILGWLIGLQRADLAFAVQVVLNILNIVLAVILVAGFGFGVEGVGFAALIAEWIAAILGLIVAVRLLGQIKAVAPWSDATDRRKLKRSLATNFDLTVRSFAGFAALFLFTSQGAAQGDVTLAANALLMTIISVTIYLLDGFAFAAEALVGRSVGARDRPMFWRAVEMTTVWAGALAVIVALALWFAGPAIIAFSTRSEAVQSAALLYLPWAALSPILGVWCFQLDGIFTGATCTREMRNMMLLSIVLFAISYWALVPPFGNHGLWAAFSLLYVFRTFTLLTRMPLLVRRSFPPSPAL